MAQDPNAEQNAPPVDAAASTAEGASADPAPAKKRSSLGSKFAAFGQKAKELGNKAVAEAQGVVSAGEARLTMEGQLKAARESLEKFLSPKLDAEKQIPVELMKGAKGIVFLSALKASIGIGASIGSGIMMAKLEDGQWSGPCSIGLLGGQWGFNIGAQKTDYIIVLRDEAAVKVFSGKGQIKFGADASIAAGPHGRDAAIAVSANDKGYAATVSYSMAKGLYVGVALAGQGISVRNDCNEKFYGAKIEIGNILSTSCAKNDDYDALCASIDAYVAGLNVAKGVEVAEAPDAEAPDAGGEGAKAEEAKQPL